ncbi:tail fiber protein [Nitrosomonas communis]|uniref:Microcystin-dependent protein n=1 Tax=Nitrosomonas communis TaxID=44574 RepID=A0A1I4U6R3_9PROT|nr:tail fiber protein [Nitrosomonas communis]SFM84706.1 Microcystin-dependent protein [Nitrosomonas communis]
MAAPDEVDPSADPLIGVIVMWGSDSLPDGWVFCDGRTLLSADYPHITGDCAKPFHVDANGMVRVPDMRGLFVRGVDDRTGTTEGDPDAASRVDMFDPTLPAPHAPYSVQLSTFASHTHEYQTAPVACSAEVISTFKFSTSDSGDFPVYLYLFTSSVTDAQDGAKETRPLNMYLRYIICVGSKLPTPALADPTPLGLIALWGANQPPPGWQLCKGTSYDAYDLGEEITIPDLRGQFIRGAGQTGRSVGSTQPDAFQAHQHTYTQFPGTFTAGLPMAQYLGGDCYHEASGRTGKTGGSTETRPVNAAFHYIIKCARGVPSKSSLPIGAIVMWSGNKGVPVGWEVCSGMKLEDPMYKDLQAILQSNFNPARTRYDPSGGPCFLPDLTGRFVRGIDDSGQNRDPDNAARTNLDGKATLGPVLGSVQPGAVAAHSHSVSSFPGEESLEGLVFGSYEDGFRGWNSRKGVSTQPEGQGETRPRNTALVFIIKYSEYSEEARP